MKRYDADGIRNVALLGHSGSGKTSLAEAMLFLSGATDRLGRVADGNTILDYDPEEIRRKVSVSAALAPLAWKDTKINLLDTPGLFDFEGETVSALRAADCAVIAMSVKAGVGVGAEKAWKRVQKSGLPRAFFVSRLDEGPMEFYRVFEQLKATFGPTVCPVCVPFEDAEGKLCIYSIIEQKAYRYAAGGARTEVPVPTEGHRIEGLRVAVCEAVAETDEALFDKYFSGESFTREEMTDGVHRGIRDGSIAPVFCGSAALPEGVDLLLDAIVTMFPSYGEAGGEAARLSDGGERPIAAKEDDPLCAIVFKTLTDPFVGKLSFFKVVSGKMTADSSVVNARTGAAERIGKLYFIRGKKQTETDTVGTGDIGAASKLTSPLTGDTLCAAQRVVTLVPPQFPEPCLSMAVAPAAKGDEDKISQGLQRLTEEDPTFRFSVDPETKEQVISGLGDQHLDVIVAKLKSKFGVSVTLAQPKVPYRETIRKKVKAEGKYKKQTGGHGQYGHVWIEFEPYESGGNGGSDGSGGSGENGDSGEMVFEEKVFGGSVPKNYFPAVEKGLRECVRRGVLAGYPVVNLKATLLDGSYHPVDSSEMAFKVAASLAYKAGMAQAAPVLLEPIGSLRALVPEANMGDVIGELNKRRGRVLGMDAEDGLQVLEAEAPLSEMHDFSTVLRSVTQGRGSFTFRFERYEEAPPQVAQAVVSSAEHAQEAV